VKDPVISLTGSPEPQSKPPEPTPPAAKPPAAKPPEAKPPEAKPPEAKPPEPKRKPKETDSVPVLEDGREIELLTKSPPPSPQAPAEIKGGGNGLGDAPLRSTRPEWSTRPEAEKKKLIEELKTTLSLKNQVQNDLGRKYDAQASNLDAQDVTYVEPKDTEQKILNVVSKFIREVKDDNTAYQSRTSQNPALQEKLNLRNKELDGLMAETRLTKEELRELAPTEMAVSDESYDSLAKSAGSLADATTRYVTKMDRTAAELLEAWDTTKHTELTNDIFKSINIAVDLVTSFGIGGNAVSQFGLKELKEVKGTFDRVSNAWWLRQGQVGDMFQAIGNTGFQFSTVKATNADGLIADVETPTNATTENLRKLGTRFNDWITEYKKPGPDPNPFVPI
jgi:hypothetical protein